MKSHPRGGTLLVVGAVALSVFLAAIVVFFGVEVLREANRSVRQADALSEQLTTESKEIGGLDQTVNLLAKDSDTALAALHLPKRTYPLTPVEPEDEGRGDAPDYPFLVGFEDLLKGRDRLASEQRFESILRSPRLGEAAAAAGVAVKHSEQGAVELTAGGRTYFSITVESASQTILTTDFLGAQSRSLELDAAFVAFVRMRTPILARHFKELGAAETAFARALDSAPIRQALQSTGFDLTAPIESSGSDLAYLLHDGIRRAALSLDERTLAVTAGARVYTNVTSFAAEFPGDVAALDVRSDTEREVTASQAEIQALADDSSFVSSLAARGVRLSRVPRTAEGFANYDLTDRAGKRVGSFSVALEDGGVSVRDDSGTVVATLQSTSLQSVPTGSRPPSE